MIKNSEVTIKRYFKGVFDCAMSYEKNCCELLAVEKLKVGLIQVAVKLRKNCYEIRICVLFFL
jgi:hypothetical protein